MIGLRRKNVSIDEERRQIALAKKGCRENANEIILRHIGFVRFRLRRKVIPSLLARYEEDLLSDSIPVLYRKIQTYNLNYRDAKGELKPVKFVSYIWKRIDGFIIDSIKKELRRERTEISGLN